MKIFMICSKHFYDQVLPYKQALEKQGHIITVPNSFDAPFKEEDMKKLGREDHRDWKRSMIALQNEKIKQNDAVFVLNFEKNGQPNYIGGATFLEIYKAYERGKKIFMLNSIPDNIFKDELMAIDPLVISGDLSLIQ